MLKNPIETTGGFHCSYEDWKNDKDTTPYQDYIFLRDLDNCCVKLYGEIISTDEELDLRKL
jgi:hypothetical protein